MNGKEQKLKETNVESGVDQRGSRTALHDARLFLRLARRVYAKRVAAAWTVASPEKISRCVAHRELDEESGHHRDRSKWKLLGLGFDVEVWIVNERRKTESFLAALKKSNSYQ